jgi:DNA-binding GntR family transcriptional regulator
MYLGARFLGAAMQNPAGDALRKIEREPLGDLAHTQLREALLGGRFEPGRVLTLRHLAELFGTSITPVRDAVNRLVAQGVLHQGARNAAVVPRLAARELRDLTLVRCELEGRAAREAAAHADNAAVEALERMLRTMRQLIVSRDWPRYLEQHRAFHFAIYTMAGVPLLHQMIDNLWLRCGPVLSYVVPHYVLLLKGSDRHAAALAAIRARDGAKAEIEIVADIEEASRYLHTLVDASGYLAPPKG